MNSFSVSDKQKVEFSSGNLCYNDSKGYHFAAQIEDLADSSIYYIICVDDNDAGRRQISPLCDVEPEHAQFLQSDVASSDLYCGWRLLSASEWTYLLRERKASTIAGMKNARFLKCRVMGIPGLLIFPDEYVHPQDVPLPHRININNITTVFRRYGYNHQQWEALQQAGCAFLPALGYAWLDVYERKLVPDAIEESGCYWTSSLVPDKDKYHTCFAFGQNCKNYSCSKIFGGYNDRVDRYFNAVRLVRDL